MAPRTQGHGAAVPVWPDMKAGVIARCAALFIDIRDSSKMSGRPGDEAMTVADRTRDFLRMTRDLWGKTPQPTSVKSVGDGLFCVWVMARYNRNQQNVLRSRILEGVLRLSQDLPAALSKAWNQDIALGMGLAFGDAAKAKVGANDDYYGYVINLASKLQDLARPSGVVVDEQFADGTLWTPSNHLSALPRKVQDLPPLERRPYKLPMAPSGKVNCLVTPDVDEIHDWTCLAWPGFAIGRGDEKHRRFGLNTRGVTVLTHEGLKGKIGSLAIWPRNGHRTGKGESFELIIDDFDSLTEMHGDRSLELYKDKGRDQEDLVTFALQSGTKGQFYFMPIRCGLNALAWHTGVAPYVAQHASYRDTLSAAAQPDDSLPVALYDNVGASLPILINAFWTPRRGYSTFDATDAVLSLVRDELSKLYAKSGKQSFLRIFTQIESLADQLRAAQVHAVLGGGAWLASGPPDQVQIASHIPEGSTGFLWIEGAGLLSHTGIDTQQLRHFLQSTVLETHFQRELMRGHPYGSCPVNAELVGKIVGGDAELKASLTKAEVMIWDETRAIYDGTDLERLSPRVELRKRPKIPEQWNALWREIKAQFCDVVDN